MLGYRSLPNQVHPALAPETGQSLSVALSQPVGQHASPLMHWVIEVLEQTAPQVPPLSNVSLVQATLSSHVVGQAPGFPAAILVSHFSEGSTVPFPQVVEQSLSVGKVQPAGQQPSPPTHCVIGALEQTAVQVPPLSRVSSVQSILSSHVVGQAPG